MLKVRRVMLCGFCSEFHTLFSSAKVLKKRLRFDKVTESLKVETCFETQCGFGSRILSTCQMRALWQNQTMHCEYFKTSWKGNHFCFLTPTGCWATSPSDWNLRWKWPTSFKKRRLRQISAYNVSTVRDSGKVQSWQIDHELSNELLTNCVR